MCMSVHVHVYVHRIRYEWPPPSKVCQGLGLARLTGGLHKCYNYFINGSIRAIYFILWDVYVFSWSSQNHIIIAECLGLIP